MIYLDNAATSYPKPEKVYEEILRCMKEYCANPGRGGHQMSIRAGRAVMEARESICSLFNIKNQLCLAFMKNATEALNTAIRGILKPGDHVITTCMEHNSVIRPLKSLEKDYGIKLTIISGNEYGEIDPNDIENSIKSDTKLVAATISSNVNGIIMPIKNIGDICRRKGIFFLLDASQGAGSIKIDVEELKIDLLAFPGHKGLLGPQGTGGLYIDEKINISSIIQGGTGSHSEDMYQPDIMPDKLESGTVNTPGIVGLGHGVEFIKKFGIDNIKQYKYKLIKEFHEGMEEIPGIKIYSLSSMEKNSGIALINFNGMDSNELSYILDKEYNIFTRAGLHCAPLAHNMIGTIKAGAVRFSVGCFNTIEEIEATLCALREISMKYKNVNKINLV